MMFRLKMYYRLTTEIRYFNRPSFVFVWFLVFYILLKNSHSYGNVTITGEGQQILTYTRHKWPLSSKGGTIVYIGNLPGLMTLATSAKRLAVELSLPTLTVSTGNRTPIFRMRGIRSTTTPSERSVIINIKTAMQPDQMI